MTDCPNNFICDHAYRYAQMDINGDIFFCCPPWVSNYSIGNIKETPFSEIWNGEKAREFRRQFMTNEFKYCRTDICLRNPAKADFKYPPESDIAPKPEIFLFNYDSVCNVRCVFCKDKRMKSNCRLDYFEDNMDAILEDMLDGVKVVVPSISGEALFSPSSRKLIKKINEKFPDIKFSFTSNGLNMTKENLTELGILDKLDNISISVHACTKKTYKKLVEFSDFDKICENLNFVSKLKKEGNVPPFHFQMNFVINAYNYKEMPAFAKWAKQLGADVVFLHLLDSNVNRETYKKLNIFDESHPKYNDLCDVVKDPIFKESFCNIPDGVVNLQKVQKSFLQKLKDYFA